MSFLETSNSADAQSALSVDSRTVVVVPVYNGHDDVVQCLESIYRWTPGSPLLVVDDASPDQRFVPLLRALAERDGRTTVLLRRASNGGFVGACNTAFGAAGRADVILVNSDVIVTEGWYDRMTTAAQSSTLVATVSTLTNHGTILSVPFRNRPVPQLPFDLTPDEAGRRVAAAGLRVYPDIPTAVGHCVLITRSAIDLIGGFDDAFGRGYGEEVDFSQRAVRAGMKNVLADDVFVFHRGGGSFGHEESQAQRDNERIVNARYPWYVKSVQVAEDTDTSPLAVALSRASIALRGLRVGLDGRALGPFMAGTQQVIIETAAALSTHPAVSELHLWVNQSLPRYAAERLAGLPIVVQQMSDRNFDPKTRSKPEVDIAYRPYQITSPDELSLLVNVGTWVVVNQLDTIAYSNPSYFSTTSQWLNYRSTTQLVLSAVDGVAYLSESSRREARAVGLIDDGMTDGVVYNAASFDPIRDIRKPAALVERPGPLLLVVGVPYHHKNRPLVVRAVKILKDSGWQGTLVLAGASPPAGSSLGDETTEFINDPSLRDHVVQMGAISEEEKRWLFENSALLLYPSVVEGFGLVPFEAATYGLASISSRQTSLDEVLPIDIPVLDDFTPESLASTIEHLLRDDNERRRIVEALTRRAKYFSAESTAALLVHLFERVTRHPPRRTAAIIDERGELTSWNPRLIPVLDRMRTERTIEPGGFVNLGKKIPALKRVVSPEGSRRQAAIRSLINRVRRFLKK